MLVSTPKIHVEHVNLRDVPFLIIIWCWVNPQFWSSNHIWSHTQICTIGTSSFKTWQSSSVIKKAFFVGIWLIVPVFTKFQRLKSSVPQSKWHIIADAVHHQVENRLTKALWFGKMEINHQVYPLVIKHSYGKSPFFMGKSTISMAIFNSYVSLPEGRGFPLFFFQTNQVCLGKLSEWCEDGVSFRMSWQFLLEDHLISEVVLRQWSAEFIPGPERPQPGSLFAKTYPQWILKLILPHRKDNDDIPE